MSYALTDEDVAEFERDEAYRRAAYPDSRGFLTIGFGRMIDGRLGGGISRDEAKFLLANDLAATEAALDRNLPWWRKMTPARRRALRNMCFNLGVTKLLGFQKMIDALRVDDYPRAAAEALNSKWRLDVGDRRALPIAHDLENG